MTNIIDRLRQRRAARMPITVTEIGASRAIFQDQDHQVIEIEFKIETGESFKLELPPRLAAKLITEVSNAHHAISPPLRLGGAAAQWMGMGSQ